MDITKTVLFKHTKSLFGTIRVRKRSEEEGLYLYPFLYILDKHKICYIKTVDFQLTVVPL
jgi:hypothetical protein